MKKVQKTVDNSSRWCIINYSLKGYIYEVRSLPDPVDRCRVRFDQ